MIDVVLCGIGGRMGRLLAGLVTASEDLRLVGATEHPGHPAVGEDIGVVIGLQRLEQKVCANLREVIDRAQVVVDFTAPGATLESACICAGKKVPMVVGTTGFSPAQLDEFRRVVAPIPCVFAPNYSTGMNLLFKLAEEAARILGEEYDVEVIEAHHRFKVDAPSGTALRLAESAARGLDRTLSEVAVYGRHGVVGKRPRKEIGIHAIRSGDLAGEHTVLFGTGGEYVELRHHATSREAFAQGALRAVRFVVAVKPGLYDMGDVLQLR